MSNPETAMKLGEILVSHEVITRTQLNHALAEQQRVNAQSKRKFRLGEILLFSKLINVQQMYASLLEQRPHKEPGK
jgi:hypothetical protein